MSKETRFWRNVVIIALAHVAVLIGLIGWNRAPKSLSTQNVVWLNGGAGDGAATKTAAPRKVAKVEPPLPEPKPKDEPEENRPVLASAKSAIQLPAATATPKPKPTTTPTSTSTPKPTPAIKATPKPTPKPKPKPTPKPKPKAVLAKASPKPSPKTKASPAESEDEDEQPDPDAEKKKIAKAALGKADAGDEEPKKAIAAQSGVGKGTSPGAGGQGGGAGGASQFGWYGNMLHDRFHSEWIQPTNEISAGEKLSVLVKIRIEKDGRVSQFDVSRPSGNIVVDESVAAVAKRVTQVDPLPDGLGSGGHYDVKINFELNSEQ
jgi:TonB family protein